MFKENTRERVANKIQPARLILERIIQGNTVPVKTARLALKNIDELMVWLEKNGHNHSK